MTTITHRVGNTRNLTPAEVDGNFDRLDAAVDALIATPPSGVTSYVALTDAATATLPTTNTPLASALALKATTASVALKADTTTVNAALALKADTSTMTTALALKVPTTRTINGQALSADVTLTKTHLSLGNVDNTADLSKPVSTLQAAAIAAVVADNLTASTTIAPSKTAVNTALADKAYLYAPVNLGTGAIALTAEDHANRALRWSGSSPVTATISTTSGTIGDLYSIANRGSAVITLPGTAGDGYKLTIEPDTVGAVEWQGSTSFLSLIPDSSSGSSVPAVITAASGTAVGDTITITPADGWFGAYQWQAWDGDSWEDISGETAATYDIEDADTQYRCEFAGLYYTNVVTSDAASAVKVRIDAPLGAIMTETGDGTAGYNYTSSTSSVYAGAGECGKSTKKLASATDGYIACIVSASPFTAHDNNARFGFVPDAADADFPSSQFTLVPFATQYYIGAQYGAAANNGSTVVPAAGDWLRVTRTGSTYVGEVSKNSGASWSTVHTWTGGTTGALQGFCGVAVTCKLDNLTSDGMA